MKRWQDRGEVLDSDDEELAESQSQGHAERKSDFPEATESTTESTHELETERLESSNPALQHHGPQNTESDQGEVDHGLEEVSRSATSADDKAQSLLHGGNNEALSTETIERNGAPVLQNSVATELWSGDSQAENGQEVVSGPKGSHSAEIKTLSESYELDTALHAAREVIESPFGSQRSSAPSSPLSERVVSPSPPAETFHFPRLQHEDSRDSSPDRNHANEIPSVHAGRLIPETHLARTSDRRNLRARNEKQLHPYLFDKAQHHKQFRERGMRPIRVDPALRQAVETQEASFSHDEREDDSGESSVEGGYAREKSSSIIHDGLFSNQAEDNLLPISQPDMMESDVELPELSAMFRQHAAASVQYGAKRRKLFHPTRSNAHSTVQQPRPANFQAQDEFSIPPSPPPTSSGSASHAVPLQAPSKFRMPRGQTPNALPTPQISSEFHDYLPDAASAGESDTGLPMRRLRTSVQSRQHQYPIAIESSEESSEAESEADVEDERLRRQRKRIKGVLPASWLKIDFRAQQKQASPSPRRNRRQSSTSPPRTVRQRGVAHKISSTMPKISDHQNAIDISDDESSEEERPRSSPSPPPMRQLRLQLEPGRGTTAPSDLVDDERMEVDWIDPMLAGSSRPRSAGKRSRKRQPRITESYKAGNTDFSEDPTAMRKTMGTGSRMPASNSSRTGRKTPKRFVAPHLSILDAPEPRKGAGQTTPQFVRVAMRRARQQSNHARHSPSGKHIRLTTKDETEDAAIILRSWREGTILPRSNSERKSNDHVIDLAADSTSDVERDRPTGANRKPLTEIGHNRQQKLPSPLRKHASKQTVIHSTRSSARGPRMQQTRLCPITLLNNDDIGQRSTNHENAITPSAPTNERQKRRELLVHTHPIRYRAAQLESLEQDLGRQHRAAEFEYRMHCLTENIVRTDREHTGGFQLARFLHSDGSAAKESAPTDEHHIGNRIQHHPNAGDDASIPLRRKPRKSQAHRIDADARDYRQPSEPLPDTINLEQSGEESLPADHEILLGLGLFGTRYATDFDILPLQLGTYFHESSFIGSGDFAASLNFANRNLDVVTGRIRVHLDGDVLEWGAWTEDVASGLSRLPRAISDALQNIRAGEMIAPDVSAVDSVLLNVDYLLRSTVRYFTRCLAFLDPIDRRHCVHAVHQLTNDLLEVLSEYESIRSITGNVLARISQYTLILTRQAFALCDHHTVPKELTERVREVVLRAANCLASDLVPGGLEALRGFYEENRHASKRESGIRDTDTAICGLVILHHVTRHLDEKHFQVWAMLCRGISPNVGALNTVSALDRAWYDIFTILPALEVDVNGIVRTGSRFQDMRQDWTFPKSLVERLLQLYPSTTMRHGSTVNEYVRATLIRCAHLISRWGWWRCDALLGTIFDFFARRGLSQLQNEECRGSPRFLEELDLQGSLDVQPEDRSFHIFLKMLASGLQSMRKHKVYPDKKIGGIAWRFIPNHGRTHRREVDLRQEDLDSLRNHHDLLCTLYYAAPPGHRLRANLVQNLVDHSISHREACRLNIRAWATLASFQTSTTEPSERLEDFCTWYRDMMSTTINQYRLARNEVEQEVASGREQGKLEPSTAIIEDTIIRNQRQIAATLVDMLSALNRALRFSFDATNAVYLLRGSAFWLVHDIFDPSARRLYGVLHEALDTIKTALHIQHRFESNPDGQQVSDDSQDYGDSTALQELVATQGGLQNPDQKIVEIIHGPLSQLVSSVFGADATTDDSLLTKLVDVWAQLAQCTVRDGDRTWSSYINGYSSDALTQLRDTVQKRKYTPYFLSRVIELGSINLTETDVLTSWLKSLVDREATLKFQHSLTTALLNRHSHELLLANLPFTRNVRGQYDVSLQELRQRRLSLISTLLFNIRQKFDNTSHERQQSFTELRQTLGAMLRHLMQAMKDNYQELQTSHNSEVADSQAQGTYVEFVQQVVSFLQQYTTEICIVDRFFTDSAGFPLPAADPTYVVGRLKSYVPKLNEGRKRKELATFVQAVSERAAVDGQQTYLVDQLGSAVSGLIARDDLRKPSLRHVLCTAVFPAYIENALLTACSWIVAVPVIDACGKMANELLYNTKVDDREDVRGICDTIGMLLQSAAFPVKAAVTHVGQLSLPHIQRTLSVIFDLVKNSLTVARFLDQTWHDAADLAHIIALFYEYAAYIDAHLNNLLVDERAKDGILGTMFYSPWPDTLDFVRKQVHDKIHSQWHAHDGHYYVRRGNHSVEVVVPLGDEETQSLLERVKEFRESYDIIFAGRKRTHHRVDGDCIVDGVIV